MIFQKTSAAKRVIAKAIVATLLLSISLFQIPKALAVTVSDSSTICQLEITSSTGVTINSSSVPVTLNDIYCIAEFKTVGTYEFTSTNTTTSLDYLVVGGGGGGGSGGGGGGGVKQGLNTPVNVSSPYTVVVGAGGAGGSGGTNGYLSTQGGQSSFSTFSVLGGGRGGQGNQAAGSGGSGGGARYDCTGSGCEGIGTVGQGNNGARSTQPGYGGGAGGGGAGGAGGNTLLFHVGGNGGPGISSSITGISTYYGGGGGGGINENNNSFCGLNSPGNANSDYFCNGGSYTTSPNAGTGSSGNSKVAATTGGGAGGLGGGGRGSSYGHTGANDKGIYANATAGSSNTGGGGGGTDPEDLGGAAGGSGIVVIRWVAPTNLKTITFDSNFGASETTTQRVVSGVSTQLNAGTFSRSGYIFSGWTTIADGTGTSYADSNNITTTSHITLYAKWITGVNKTVTFNGNSSTSGSMATQSAGTATTLNLNQFLQTNYTFTGWNTQANGSGYSYANGAVYAFATDTTLYAQWRADRTSYTVTFIANAGEATGSTPSQTTDTPTALTLNGFSRAGYNFLGWNTTFNANTASYLDGQTYNFTSSINLYAIWVAQAPNSVTFNGNGESSGATASQTASASTTLNANGFFRDGYTFLKWNTQSNGSGVSYNSGYTYSFAASLPLYAIWSRNLTISYASNLATSGDTPTAQSYYVGGPTITVSNNAGNLARTGFTFTGWNTAADGSGRAYATGGSNSTFTDDTLLYAQWVGSTYYILYSDNESSSGSAPSTQSFVYGGSGITIASNTGSLQKTGYTFNQWNTQADGSGTTYVSGATNQIFAADTVLYAKWSGNTYTLVYDQNRGTGETSTTSFTYGNNLNLLNPTRTGYTFSGWYDTTTAGLKIADGGATYSAALSRTLYGQWTINSYTYTYNANGGSVDTTTVLFTYGDPDITLRTPTRMNYQFDGWFTANTGGIRIGSGGQLHTPSATRTLFAQWTQLSLVGLTGATKIGTILTSAGNGNTFSVSNSGTNINVTYIADSLPDATVIDLYLLSNTNRAAGLIADARNLLLSIVVAWKASDNTVPDTAPGSPISMTITNASIKAGAKIYSLVGDNVTLLGTATVDGSATAVFSQDPEIVIANPPATSSNNGSSGGGGSNPSVVKETDSTKSNKIETDSEKTSQGAKGPTVQRTVITKVVRVFFPMGEARITPTQLKTLERTLADLRKNEITEIRVRGFVQKTSLQVNDKALPQLRAKKVAAIIKKSGIAIRALLSSGGYATEKNEKARRVEITVKIVR